MTKIIGLCASPRHASSEYVAEEALKAAAAFDPRIETELISFSGKRIDPCVDCGYCKSHKSWCVKKDDVQDILDKVVQASGIIVVSPVYVMSATPQFHAFCSRMRPLMHCFPELVRNKFFAAVSVGGTRNGGEETTINDIMNLFATRTMNFVSNESGGYTGAKVWSKDQGAAGAAADTTGMETVRSLGAKLAEVCLIYDMGKEVYLQNQKGR